MMSECIGPANKNFCNDHRKTGVKTAFSEECKHYKECLASKIVNFTPKFKEKFCEMSLKKCLGCPLSHVVPSLPECLTGGDSIPCKIQCLVSVKEIEITKCIKEA